MDESEGVIGMALGMGAFAGLSAAADQGLFAVSPEAGERMRVSISDMRDEVQTQLQAIQSLRTQAKLGEMPEAQAVAQLNMLVAGGDQQSLEFVLRRFAEALEHAENAVRTGMANYAQVEESNSQGVGGIWV